jgi:hypothetical protein
VPIIDSSLGLRQHVLDEGRDFAELLERLLLALFEEPVGAQTRSG